MDKGPRRGDKGQDQKLKDTWAKCYEIYAPAGGVVKTMPTRFNFKSQMDDPKENGKFSMIKSAIPHDNIFVREKQDPPQMQMKTEDPKNDASNS